MTDGDKGQSEVRPWNDEDRRRDLAVEMLKRHARAARPDTDYDADIEYLEYAVVAFADEWAAASRTTSEPPQ